MVLIIMQDERNKDTLVYADIGPSQFRQQIPLLPVPCDFYLDDNAVEYAKLNHTLTSAATTVESKADGIADISCYNNITHNLKTLINFRYYCCL